MATIIMEEEILDLQEEKQPKRLFSILSVVMAVVNLSLAFIATFSSKIFIGQSTLDLIFGLARILSLTIILGAIFSIISIVRREKIKYFNFTAKTVNLVFFILLAWMILNNLRT